MPFPEGVRELPGCVTSNDLLSFLVSYLQVHRDYEGQRADLAVELKSVASLVVESCSWLVQNLWSGYDLSWASCHHVPKNLSISWAPRDPQLLIFIAQ